MSNSESDNEEFDDVLRPTPQTLAKVLRHEGNWKCLFLTVIIIGCLATVTYCNTNKVQKVVFSIATYPKKSTVVESVCEPGYAYVPLVLASMLYTVYLVECYHSTARIQLSKKVDVQTVMAKVNAMKEAIPRVWWKAICYHYLRRKRRVTRYRHGDPYTATQVYYERVNTHSATAAFSHACCGQTDVTRTLQLTCNNMAIIKVRFSKGFAFANVEAASEFEDQRSRFFTDHERYDDFMEMREGLDLVGVTTFKEYLVAYKDLESFSIYSSQLVFWLMSLLLLSWPLRIITECNTAYVHYTITKLFGTNYEEQTHNRPPLEPAVSLASTVDSLELFAAIRENCTIAPSYSEALRLEPIAGTSTKPVCVRVTIENDLPKSRILRTVSQYSIVPIRKKNKPDRRSWTPGTIVNSDYSRIIIHDEEVDEPPPPYEEAIQMVKTLTDRVTKLANRRSRGEGVQSDIDEVRLLDSSATSSPKHL